MGAFFGSILIKTENSGAVQTALETVGREAKCKFLMGPALNGWISVLPNDSGQNDQISVELTRLLPEDIFHLIVHDDGLFAYFFYRQGRLLDQYNSDPDYFEAVSREERNECRGRPELYQDLLPAPDSLSKLKALLAADKEKYVFEQERMSQFVELLGLSNALTSYEYLQEGERDGIKGWKKFIHIPDLSAEKTARRAAQARVKSEKKRLQTEGILLTEIKPPKEKGPGLPGSIAWGTDSATHGLVLSWQSFHFTKAIDDEQYATEFHTIQPPWTTPPVPLGLKTNWTAHVFCTSPGGDWLAGGFVAGDWTLRVWDWRRKELAFEVPHQQAVQWLVFSPDEQWIYSLGGEEFVVTSMATKQRVVTVNGMLGARGASVHPSGKFAAVGLQDKLGIIDLEKQELIKKLWVNRKMETFDPFARDTTGTVIKTCLKTFLENPKIRQKLGVDAELQAAILQDPKAVEKLTDDAQQHIKSMLEKVRSSTLRLFEIKEHIFDTRFSPDGGQLFVAGGGIRVFDWNKLLAADTDAPSPELSVDAPREDETDPNSRPLAYCVRFDPVRKLVLSSCLAGVIQYLNLNDGRSGILLKPPEEVTIWRLELTSDNQALCCHSGSRPGITNQKNRFNCVQVWNYPALCKAAGIN